jgi:hypothetical protein
MNGTRRSTNRRPGVSGSPANAPSMAASADRATPAECRQARTSIRVPPASYYTDFSQPSPSTKAPTARPRSAKALVKNAQKGGTPHKAPIGYVNFRDPVVGERRGVASVKIDEERGFLVTRAFELYATGRYTLDGFVALLSDEGLTSRPTRRSALTRDVEECYRARCRWLGDDARLLQRCSRTTCCPK